MTEKRVTGPVQVFVIGFDDFEVTGRIMAELRRVRRRGLIRLVDVIFVQKDDTGSIVSSMHLTDLSEAERKRLGAIAGALIGLGAGGLATAADAAELGVLTVAREDAWLNTERLLDLAATIPAGGAAAVLVVEHHWATALRDSIAAAGGRTLAETMVSADALKGVGEELRERLEEEEAIELAEEAELAAAVSIAESLARAHLIRASAVLDAAEAIAFALATEDAVAERVADELLAARMIDEHGWREVTEIVRRSMRLEPQLAESDPAVQVLPAG